MLLGVRYSDALAHALFEEVSGMKQSATYQAIVRRSRAEGACRMLLLIGATKFGSPDADVRAAIESIEHLPPLWKLGLRLMSASSWQELLPPRAQRRLLRRCREGQQGDIPIT
jgi:hypothetical protein